MARDPLRVLQMIRQREVDQSRQVLATCLKAEAAANAVIQSIDDAIVRENGVADRPSEHRRNSDMVAAWLRRMRLQRSAAGVALTEAERQTAAARAELAAARSAARSVERLIEERTMLAREEADRQEQHALDDIARGGLAARRMEKHDRSDP